jgi:hypothetical protein
MYHKRVLMENKHIIEKKIKNKECIADNKHMQYSQDYKNVLVYSILFINNHIHIG